MSQLLAQNKARKLSTLEKTELDCYLTLEHLARLAKAREMATIQMQ